MHIRKFVVCLSTFAAVCMLICVPANRTGATISTPVSVYSSNPRYLVNNGKPIVLLGMGASLSSIKSRDYRADIDRMATNKAIYARVWHILPWIAPDAYFPWARDGGGTAKDGGQKFNLTHWDSNYWTRLKDACAYAQSKNIYLSIHIFDECGVEVPTSSTDHRWDWHPFNPTNNVNGLSLPTSGSAVPAFYSLTNTNLKSLQELYVAKLISETSGYPNVMYEICNEYTGPWDWEKHWIDFVSARCSNMILVNRLGSIPSNYWTDSKIDVVNFHWGTMSSTTTNQNMVAKTTNSSTPKAINYDEPPELSSSTFQQYRGIAWASFIGGGHIHLEGGTQNPGINDTVRYLQGFIESNAIPFHTMRPMNSVVTATPGGTAFTLGRDGSEYVTYITGSGSGSMTINLPSGKVYSARAYNPSNGSYTNLTVSGTRVSGIPSYSQDIVIHVKATGSATTSSPNISLTLAVDKSTALSGEILTYTVTYKNTGDGDAKSVAITNPIPQYTTYVSGSASSGGTYDSTARTVKWSISSVIPGASGTLTFRVKVD